MSDPNSNAPASAGGQGGHEHRQAEPQQAAQQQAASRPAAGSPPQSAHPAPQTHAGPDAASQAAAHGYPAQPAAAQHTPAQHTPAQPAAAQPAAAQPAAAQPAAAQPKKRLSGFLKVSIILLAGLTIASISLLFIGDFEGKFERVFSTFVLFAVFVLFTALDTRLGRKSEWYAPVALIANAYILGLLLIVIWMTRYDPFALMWEIFWKSIFVILVTRLVILCCQLLLQAGARMPSSVSVFAFVTSVLAVLAGILFTAPIGIDAFDLHIPDLYWKIATAMLILTALGLSITLLLRWFYGSEAREQARAAAPAGVPYAGAPGQQIPQQPVPAAAPAPQGRPLLPWPTYPDGRPLPAGPDGQPDFSVLQRPPHQ